MNAEHEEQVGAVQKFTEACADFSTTSCSGDRFSEFPLYQLYEVRYVCSD